MGEWGYGVGEREGAEGGCYGSCRGGTGLCIEGFGSCWAGRAGGGVVDGRVGVMVGIRYFPLLYAFFLLFRKLGRWGF